MLVLAIDTCNSFGSVALLRDDTVVSTAEHTTGDDYSSWLLPAVSGVLSQARLNMAEVDLFGVAAGPGSFTALRVGLTTVKAWAEVYGRPIVPVSRLELIASQAAGGTDHAGAWADAQRGQVFGAVYRRDGSRLHRVGEEVVIEPGRFVELAANLTNGQRMAWASPDADCVFATPEWQSRQSLNENFAPVAKFLAIEVARRAAADMAAGRCVDALALDANYVRRSDAEIFWKGYGQR